MICFKETRAEIASKASWLAFTNLHHTAMQTVLAGNADLVSQFKRKLQGLLQVVPGLDISLPARRRVAIHLRLSDVRNCYGSRKQGRRAQSNLSARYGVSDTAAVMPSIPFQDSTVRL